MGEDVGFSFKFAIMLSVLMVLFITSITILTQTVNIRFKKVASEENWDYYYNGNKVNEEYLDINMYSASYDLENKRVYLTDRHDISYRLVFPPIIR